MPLQSGESIDPVAMISRAQPAATELAHAVAPTKLNRSTLISARDRPQSHSRASHAILCHYTWCRARVVLVCSKHTASTEHPSGPSAGGMADGRRRAGGRTSPVENCTRYGLSRGSHQLISTTVPSPRTGCATCTHPPARWSTPEYPRAKPDAIPWCRRRGPSPILQCISGPAGRKHSAVTEPAVGLSQ